MKQVLIDLDDDVAQRLEQVAPARSRKRSEFVRAAIRKALWDLEEDHTAAAYLRQPDRGEDAYVDPAVWETATAPTRPRGRR